MPEKRLKDIQEYREWLEENFDVRVDELKRKHYSSVTSKVKLNLESSDFWNDFLRKLKGYNDQYSIKSGGYDLLIPHYKPEILIKSFDSFFLKSFRKNVIFNENWPSEPPSGWILPNNWYTKINDMIRTLIVVKYLDGAEFLANSIEGLCKSYNIKFKKFYVARDEGYYALHLYINLQFEIPTLTYWDTEIIPIFIEIQVTTQLQEVIRRLLHRYYEKEREKRPKKDSKEWKWNYQSEEFMLNYLGHILHYTEGMILQIRDKQIVMKNGE